MQRPGQRGGLEYWKGEFRWPPYVWWPQPGSLVQWASWEHESFHWLTTGHPDDWPVVVMRDNEQLHQRIAMTATELIHALLAGPFPVSFVSDMSGADVEFRPSSTWRTGYSRAAAQSGASRRDR